MTTNTPAISRGEAVPGRGPTTPSPTTTATSRPSFLAVAPDGQRFKLRFDGIQDLISSAEVQFTALEEIPGLVPAFGTTYAASIVRRGFRIEEAV